ncbi:transcription factor IIA, alpha/beta subunit [Daldinia caldariorum]|uniref:transcription factor IIA, alpha/beta subunit n=1 Tax=Daldinia caldariorum TaxID=326644 RepID=UPI002007F4D6|nr:transcription factor IIA, alpha/beta subunit [Daldinia caldariorum]KAI1465498.1 transcription factor IIA, alpha/beta subunit [Daldinia caldariorum]
MSNSQVGNVYQQIINDVLEASRVDFEEGGVDESVLEELKRGWQKKLSQQQLATFPWDPKPDAPTPSAAAASAAVAPAPEPIPQVNGSSFIQEHVPQPQPQPQGLTMPMAGGQPSNGSGIKSEPGVKTEPGLENSPMTQTTQQSGPGVVQERVSQQLQSMYGDRAAASINKLREQSFPQNQQRPGNQPIPQNYQGQYQQGAPQQQYRPGMAPNGQQPQQQQQQQPQPQQQQQQRMTMPNGQRPAPSQMDGADGTEDNVGVLLRRTSAGENVEMGRVEIDNLLHAQIAAHAKAMEGGGLMLPLKRKGKNQAVSQHSTPLPGGISQVDGTDDDVKDEASDDADAINSDLDDPDDNIEDDDDDEDGGQIMLCMYDKVQRVKNKWKCVLKDGVLSVNGKDYVFHKATGEYEW